MSSNVSEEDLNEIEGKTIVHWNYRGLSRLPEVVRFCAKDIREIYLKDNKLKDLPDWIIELVNVTHLYFHGNNLKKIPSHLASLTHLMLLDLSKNGIHELPPSVGDLRSLESLQLDDNFLKRLPSELRSLRNLLSLSICKNEFVVLPEWLASLEKLEQLRADENSLEELPNGLTKSSSLQVLSVCSNRLTYLPLNGFVSCPSIYFHSNPGLNYLSYPIFRRLTHNSTSPRLDPPKYGNYERRVGASRNLRIVVFSSEGERGVIELPRQLFKVHPIDDNVPVSLWELALRRIYDRERDTSNVERDDPSLGASYNLLVNGPIAVCVNDNCREPIFTETWLIPAISCPQDSFSKRITIVVLYCSKNCVLNFESLPEEFEPLRWQSVDQR